MSLRLGAMVGNDGSTSCPWSVVSIVAALSCECKGGTSLATDITEHNDIDIHYLHKLTVVHNHKHDTRYLEIGRVHRAYCRIVFTQTVVWRGGWAESLPFCLPSPSKHRLTTINEAATSEPAQ